MWPARVVLPLRKVVSVTVTLTALIVLLVLLTYVFRTHVHSLGPGTSKGLCTADRKLYSSGSVVDTSSGPFRCETGKWVAAVSRQ
jgi:hypothetical protein